MSEPRTNPDWNVRHCWYASPLHCQVRSVRSPFPAPDGKIVKENRVYWLPAEGEPWQELERSASALVADELARLATALAEAERERDALRGRVERLVEALSFYASFDTWWAVSLLSDRPCGEIMDDFDVDPEDPHESMRPGKRARATLLPAPPTETPPGDKG